MSAGLGWVGIARLALVQAAIGAVVVLVTSTLNRVMVVELVLPAIVPGLLIALHYAVQLLRPRWGHGSDGTGRRTPWILGGMAALSVGGIGAALATAAMATHPMFGALAAALAFGLVGLGVGAAGTALLVLAATAVAPARRAVAAPVMWITMIAGFAITAGVAGACLDPFGFPRLVTVVTAACIIAFAVATLALWGLEGSPAPGATFQPPPTEVAFGPALRAIWAEPAVCRFTVFVFVSMLAYSAQDLVLEPFAGAVLGVPLGGTTALTGLQHGGALLGMIAVAVLGGALGRRRAGLMGRLAVGGCLLSALVLVGLAACGFGLAPSWPLRPAVVLLGFGNGAFAVSAVGAMMMLAAAGGRREGLRMGLWGAAQAAAFGLGSLIGPAAVDAAKLLLGTPSAAYGCVFLIEAALFVVSAALARDGALLAPPREAALVPAGAT